MTPLTSIRKNKGGIAFIFAASILAVTACDVICSVERTSVHDQKISPLANHHARNGHHEQGESHSHHGHDKDISHHSHSNSPAHQDGNCCEDITSQFYKSLFNGYNSVTVQAPALTFVLLTILDNYKSSDTEDFLNSSPKLPPKIPPDNAGLSLRIRINSFLI